MLSILTAGDWPPGRVASRWNPAQPPVSDAAKNRIDQAWQKASARPGIHLFDGPMCRLDQWRATPDHLDLSFSPTTYKHFLGTNMTDPAAFAPDELANPLGLSPALLTSDDFLMFGHRSSSVAYYPNRIHPFAGALEPADATVFDGMLRELHEELSLEPPELIEQRCIGIVSDNRLRQPEMIFYMRTSRTNAEIARTLEKLEHRSCVAIPSKQNRVEQAISDPAMTPVGVGTLLLYGRRAFGDEWYARRCAALASALPCQAPKVGIIR